MHMDLQVCKFQYRLFVPVRSLSNELQNSNFTLDAEDQRWQQESCYFGFYKENILKEKV